MRGGRGGGGAWPRGAEKMRRVEDGCMATMRKAAMRDGPRGVEELRRLEDSCVATMRAWRSGELVWVRFLDGGARGGILSTSCVVGRTGSIHCGYTVNCEEKPAW